MNYYKISTPDEAKAYFESLWLPMESYSILKNLKQILNFLQNSAEEVCFVNIQEKYLPLYYMIVLDQKILEITFLTDECKVVANEIIRSLKANKNYFAWEVSFSTKSSPIHVIFKKVYIQPQNSYPVERYEKLIQTQFKKTWIKTTLKFIKSSRLILKYPEMTRQEALYLYKGILKLNNEELGFDSLWAPVWEALNIFKLRYQYIVSLHPTTFDYAKFVHFEKIILQRKHPALESKNAIVTLKEISESKLRTDGISNDDKKKENSCGKANDVLLPVVDHKDLIKNLLEMNVPKSGTTVYTLKVDESNVTLVPAIEEFQSGVNGSADNANKTDILLVSENETVKPESAMLHTKSPFPDDQIVDVSLTHDEVNVENIQDIDLNKLAININDTAITQDTTVLSENPIKKLIHENDSMSDLECNKNKSPKKIEVCKNIAELEIKLQAIEKAVEDFKLTTENEVNESNCISKVASPDIITIDVDDENQSVIVISDTEMDVTYESSPQKTNADSVHENPFIQQILKLQGQGHSSFLTEKDFISSDNIIELKDTSDDIIRNLTKKAQLKNTTKLPPSAKTKQRNEMKIQRRLENKIRQKRRLIEMVSIKFILTSFKAVLDFINDDLRASMEVVGLNLQEFNVLRKLHGFSPDVVPVERVFEDPCIDLATQIFERLKGRNDYNLEINWIKPGRVQRNLSTDGMRHRAVEFTKRPFKKIRNIISCKLNTLNKEKNKVSQVLRNPKSILDKKSLMSLRTGMSSASSTVSLEGHITSRSSSVSSARAKLSTVTPKASPARYKMSPRRSKLYPTSVSLSRLKLDQLNSPHDAKEDSSDRPVRTPVAKSDVNSTVTMKEKLLEGLAVPLESDKAMRMMRLMGWNGGALGIRGEGLIEPIRPQLDVPKGFGLGHKKFKSTKLNINKLQRKVMNKKNKSVQMTETAIIDNGNSEDIFQINENEKYDNVTSGTMNDEDNIRNVHFIGKPKTLNGDKQMNPIKLIECSFNNNVNEYQKCSSNKIANNSLDNDVALKMESNLKIDSKQNTDDIWTPNASLLQNIQDGIISNVNVVESVKSKIKTVATEEMERSGWLTNERILQTIKDKSTHNACGNGISTKKQRNYTEMIKDVSRLTTNGIVHKSMDTLRFNNENLVKGLQKMNEDGHGPWKVAGDKKLKPYTRETKSKCLSDRMQFLVHLLDLLQSAEKSLTVVSYVKKPIQACICFIESVISSLNGWVSTAHPSPEEERIIIACAREMEAHKQLHLSCRFKKRLLTLVKTDSSLNHDPLTSYPPYLLETNFDTTHSVCDYRLYKQMPQGVKGINRIKIFTNRVMLEFIKSNDEKRVYDYGRTSGEIRLYVISLISLLNRKMADYQLGLGNSEHPVFREMLDGMKNFYLLFRFDTQESYFHKLQLVKVNLMKRCRICQSSNPLLNPSERVASPYEIDDENAEDIDDIELYPNRFDDSKDHSVYKSDNDITVDNSTSLNTERVFENKVYDTDCTEVNVCEQYLIGENWLESDVIDKTNSDNEANNKTVFTTDDNYENMKNDNHMKLFNTKENHIEDITKDTAKGNASNEELSSDFHNWPKRIKRNENNNDVTNQRMKWNTAERYEGDFQAIPKRKVISMEKKTDEDTIEDDVKLNEPDNVPIAGLDHLHKLNKETSKDNCVEVNTEKVRSTVVKNIIEITRDTKIDFNQGAVEVKTKVIESNTENIDTGFDNWTKNVLIVHHEYPRFVIDGDLAILLQSILYEAIKKERYLPSLKCWGLRNGGLLYTCYDHKSHIWFCEQLQHSYTLLDYEEDLNVTHVIEMKIDCFLKIDINIIFSNIEMFYNNIKTSSWKVIETKDFANFCIITIEIDESSLKNIRKENYSLFVGIDKVDISLKYDRIK